MFAIGPEPTAGSAAGLRWLQSNNNPTACL